MFDGMMKNSISLFFLFWFCIQLCDAQDLIQRIKSMDTISYSELLSLNTIDTNYTHHSSGGVYCDTSVVLNDSVFYSIISLSDDRGICSFNFILTFDLKRKKAIASKFLSPNCDIDFSANYYKLYDYSIVSNNRIQLTLTEIHQKKNRTSDDDEENIDRKEITESYFDIESNGEIK